MSASKLVSDLVAQLLDGDLDAADRQALLAAQRSLDAGMQDELDYDDFDEEEDFDVEPATTIVRVTVPNVVMSPAAVEILTADAGLRSVLTAAADSEVTVADTAVEDSTLVLTVDGALPETVTTVRTALGVATVTIGAGTARVFGEDTDTSNTVQYEVTFTSPETFTPAMILAAVDQTKNSVQATLGINCNLHTATPVSPTEVQALFNFVLPTNKAEALVNMGMFRGTLVLAGHPVTARGRVVESDLHDNDGRYDEFCY